MQDQPDEANVDLIICLHRNDVFKISIFEKLIKNLSMFSKAATESKLLNFLDVEIHNKPK